MGTSTSQTIFALTLPLHSLFDHYRSEYMCEYHGQWYQANKERVRQSKRAWMKLNPEAHNGNGNKYKKMLQTFIDDQKKGKACVRCGIDDYRVLDFHHIDLVRKR